VRYHVFRICRSEGLHERDISSLGVMGWGLEVAGLCLHRAIMFGFFLVGSELSPDFLNDTDLEWAVLSSGGSIG